jgi:hypothetical protein
MTIVAQIVPSGGHHCNYQRLRVELVGTSINPDQRSIIRNVRVKAELAAAPAVAAATTTTVAAAVPVTSCDQFSGGNETNLKRS